jgi:hypothetical protein
LGQYGGPGLVERHPQEAQPPAGLRPAPVGTLASRVGAHPGALYRLLRAAVSVGVFTADDQGRFGLNPVGECLRSDAPGSLRLAAMMFGLEPFWVP